MASSMANDVCMATKQTLGVVIRKARERKGWSQDRLADELTAALDGQETVTQGAVSQWERNIHPPSIYKIPVIAMVLGLDPHDLLDLRAGLMDRMAENADTDLMTAALRRHAGRSLSASEQDRVLRAIDAVLGD